MKHLIEIFSVTMIMILNVYLVLGFFSAGLASSNAVNYKTGVIARIECSDLNDSVIASCISKAKEDGYELTVSKECNEETDMNFAQVELKYRICIPLLNLNKTLVTSGVAR